MHQASNPNNAGREYLSVSGVNLEVMRSSGTEKNAPTLVFLHEGLGCIEMWRDFPAKLTRLTGCPAFVYSRQGYGHSDPCELPRPLNYMHIEALDILPKLLDAASIEEYILIGHSDGGSIALIHAGGSPDKGLRGVITMAPHVFCEELSVRSIAEAKKTYLEDNLRARLSKYHLDNTDCAFWGWNDAWLDPEFIHWNIEEYLPGIRVPQLVLQGKEDQYGTIAQLHAIEQKTSASVDVRILADCGHSPYREQEEISLELGQDFIKNLVGEGLTRKNAFGS